MITNCGGGSFKSQFKRADKSGARIVLILGDEEVDKGIIGIKDLRGDGEQLTISQTELAGTIGNMIFS